jgi:hypothetical protein
MITFENQTLKLQFGNERYFYGLFKIMILLLSVAFYHKFNQSFHVTSVGRSHNPKSAHCDSDKLVCAIDIRSKDMTLEQITWLANQDAYLHPYVDIIIEDHRMAGNTPAGGDHVHIELNPGWWIKF